jgi:hypothetical protein
MQELLDEHSLTVAVAWVAMAIEATPVEDEATTRLRVAMVSTRDLDADLTPAFEFRRR